MEWEIFRCINDLDYSPSLVVGTPLIIVPVQSEGIPSSGSGLPLGRPHPASPDDLPQGEELCKMLTQQLEYYFSKDNLSSDKYLCKQMTTKHPVTSGHGLLGLYVINLSSGFWSNILSAFSYGS